MKVNYFVTTLFLLIFTIFCLFNTNITLSATEGYFAIGDFSISQPETYVE